MKQIHRLHVVQTKLQRLRTILCPHEDTMKTQRQLLWTQRHFWTRNRRIMSSEDGPFCPHRGTRSSYDGADSRSRDPPNRMWSGRVQSRDPFCRGDVVLSVFCWFKSHVRVWGLEMFVFIVGVVYFGFCLFSVFFCYFGLVLFLVFPGLFHQSVFAPPTFTCLLYPSCPLSVSFMWPSWLLLIPSMFFIFLPWQPLVFVS